MSEANFVGMGPDVVHVQTGERKEASVGAVEFLDGVCQFQVVFFLKACIEIGLEDWLLGLVPQVLDKSCVIQPVEDFFADVFQGGHVRIQQDDADTVPIGKVADDIDEPEVGKHGEQADTPGLLDRLVRPGPAQQVELVGVNLDKDKRLAGAVRPKEFLVQPCPEKTGRIDDVFQSLLRQYGVNGWIYRFLFHDAKYSK